MNPEKLTAAPVRCRSGAPAQSLALVLVLVQVLAAAVPARAQPPQWSTRWNGPADRHDEPIKVLAVPAGGSLLLARSGLAPPLMIEQRLVLLRHGDDGAPLWSQVDPLLESAEFVEPDLALAGTDAAVVAGYSGTTVVVRRLGLVDGGTIWQRERPLPPPLSARRPLRAAFDPASGQVLVSVADQGQLRVLRWQGDGAALPDLHLAVAGFDLEPGAVVAGPDGEVTVAAREQEQTKAKRFGSDSTLVVGFAADGAVRFQQREGGPLGIQFGLPWLAADAQGTVTALAEVESACGVPQQQLWRLDRQGERQWLRSWPDHPCASSTPVALALVPDGAAVVVHTAVDSTVRMGAIRFRTDGSLAWAREWPGVAPAFGSWAVAGAVDAAGRVLAVGNEHLPGSTSRLAFAQWTADGGLCGHGHDAQGWRASASTALDGGGWLVAGFGPGLAPGSTATDVLLQRYPAPGDCPVDALFGDGFDP